MDWPGPFPVPAAPPVFAGPRIRSSCRPGQWVRAGRAVMGPLMPAPFSPDPPSRPPAPPPDAKAPSTHTTEPEPPTTTRTRVTPLAAPTPHYRAAHHHLRRSAPGRAPSTPTCGAGLAGRKLGHFELIEPIGVGGMAAVLKARDLELGRDRRAEDPAAGDRPATPRTSPASSRRPAPPPSSTTRTSPASTSAARTRGCTSSPSSSSRATTCGTMIDRRGPLPAGECVRYMIQVAAGLAPRRRARRRPPRHQAVEHHHHARRPGQDRGHGPGPAASTPRRSTAG